MGSFICIRRLIIAVIQRTRAGCSISTTVYSAWKKDERFTHRSSPCFFQGEMVCALSNVCAGSMPGQFKVTGETFGEKNCWALSPFNTVCLYPARVCFCTFTSVSFFRSLPSPDAMLCMAGVGAAFTDIYYQEMAWLLEEGTAQELLLLQNAFIDVSHCTVI